MQTPTQRLLARRDMLKGAACGFGYMALASMCADSFGATTATPAVSPILKPNGVYHSPLAPKLPHFAAKAKRVIFLFMQGGPSHLDTFDYKPKLISDNGKAGDKGKLLAPVSTFKPRGKSGLMISDLFPNVAQHADDMCILNGMATDNPAHPQATIQLHTGSVTFVRPSMGAWVLYGLGTQNQDLPGYITIAPPAGLGGAQNYGSAFLPATFQGTRVEKDGVADIRSPVAKPLQRQQIDLIQQMNRDFGGQIGPNEQLDGLIESFELGFRMQGTVPDVMDISKESKQTLELYGADSGPTATFGKQCLMARRLAESGVRFIEVCHQGWDHHNGLRQRLGNECGAIDKPIAGLLTDLKQRGLLKDTLVVWGGEFGRTPGGQNTDGRNHNNRGYSMWMAGGGVKGGINYGKTDEHGGHAVENKTHVHDLHATILALLGLDHEKLTFRYAGRDFRLTDVYGNVAKQIIA